MGRRADPGGFLETPHIRRAAIVARPGKEPVSSAAASAQVCSAPSCHRAAFSSKGEGCYVLLFLLSPPPSIPHCPPWSPESAALWVWRSHDPAHSGSPCWMQATWQDQAVAQRAPQEPTGWLSASAGCMCFQIFSD